ncbi:MAG TPA: hypothetical protein VGG16_27430 [Streptosporangiaceae bacterium]
MTGMQTTPRRSTASPERKFQLWPPRMSWDPTGAVDKVIGVIRNVVRSLAPASLWRNHRMFTIVACLSILPRFVAAMGFKPALLIQDSFSYMSQSIHLQLGQLRPAGYPMMLRILEPFHSLLLVTTIQHIMGIGLGVMIYVILRTRGLPAWGATLAAVPTLFDSRQIWLESSILPDTLFTVVLMIAVAILIVRTKPGIREAVVVGLLVAYASVIRGNGAPVFVVILAFLLIRRVGWRVITASVAAFAVPLLGYAFWFHGVYGQFNITNSSGLFLWSRTMSFANCSIIKPPPDLVPLCPENQPEHPAGPTAAWSIDAVMNQRTPAEYLWDSGVWYEHDAHPGVNAYNDKLAMQFAERAILAQPLDYLKTVGEGVFLTFFATDRPNDYLSDHFTVQPHVHGLAHWMYFWENKYAHTEENTHPHQPWAYLMFWYQSPVWFPGWVFCALFLLGFGFIVKRWRRGWGQYAALAWTVGVVNLVVPIAAHELDYRYALSSVPFACLAFALALNRKPAPGQVELPPPAQAVTAGADPAGPRPATA